ncbi:hypothetical protein ACFP81_14510 [Deinococcus lacus]|uniref:Uncharacterized protein n=1 Tax=Deinococcus lacus TaxID=392561 RepID=A0ABW1YIT9_9DEIO
MLDQARVWRLYIEQWESATTEPLYCQLGEIGSFRLKVGGRPPYEFVLFNPQICDIRIWNPGRWDGKAAGQTGQLFVSFRSVFLQRYGLHGARRIIRELVELLGVSDPANDHGPEFDRISRIDLAVDTQEERGMLWADLDAFVCRSRILDTWTTVTPQDMTNMLERSMLEELFPMDSDPHLPTVRALARAASACITDFTRQALVDLEQYGEANLSRVVTKSRTPQTIYFGRFGSELYARRYNKLGSLAIQNKLYMLEIWQQNGWDCESPVIRTEFSMSGDFLKNYILPETSTGENLEIDARDLDLIEVRIPYIWSYLTKKWLRFTEPKGQNVKRWKINSVWAEIQTAFSAYKMPFGVRDLSRSIPREDIHLVKQSRGCNVTVAALRFAANPAQKPTDVLADLFESMINAMEADGFLEDVENRMLELGIDAYTDTCLTSMFRAEKMKEGYGS